MLKSGMRRPTAQRHGNLPAHRIRLIGRERDLQDVRDALLGAEGRLLTLTGTGGCGKTRLALELAADVRPHFPEGVGWSSSPPCSTPRLCHRRSSQRWGFASERVNR